MTKTFQAHALRALTLSAAAALAPTSSQAALSLTIPTHFLEANAVQAFSEKAMQAFDAIQIVFSGKGNATAVPGATGPTGMASAYNLPVTSVSLQLIKISGGSATGSALEFLRLDDFDQVRQVTLANFRLDFVSKQILADATQNNEPTQLAPRRFVWKPTATIGGGRSAVWACGQVAERLVHMPMRPCSA